MKYNFGFCIVGGDVALNFYDFLLDNLFVDLHLGWEKAF
jgi:hypothetical protein